MKLASVVMAGGIGRRLYPLSTEERPKYFIENKVGTSLLEAAIFRAKLLEGDIFISCNRKHLEPIKGHLARKFSDYNIRFIVEPISRNTGPILLMLAKILEAYDRIQVIQSDHLFLDFLLFKEVSYQMVNNADKYKFCLLTKRFGTEDPKEFGQITLSTRKGSFSPIKTFHEKRELHSTFDKRGLHINLGNQVFSPRLLIDFIYKNPGNEFICELFNLATKGLKVVSNNFIIPESYDSFPNISVDKMFLEQGLDSQAIYFLGEWYDIGSRGALDEWLKSDFELE